MRVVTVASGKGGVGKSTTVSLKLALALAERGHRVGLLDAELLVDLPRGTADLQQQLLRLVRPAGAVIVVGPQDVAYLDARKVLDLLGEAQIPVLGGVENFAGLACPHCGESVEVFPQVAYERSIWAAGVTCLGKVPMDAAVATAGDTGWPLLLAHPASRPAQALREIASRLTAALDADAGD
jgi:ATP-binding protein involved in chromosome partitioning